MKTDNINQVAAQFLLSDEDDQKLKQMKEAASVKVGQGFRRVLTKVLSEETKLPDEKIDKICSRTINEFLKG